MHTPRTRSSLYSPRNSEPILRELTRARLPAKSPPYRTLRMLAHGHGSGVVGFQVDRGIGAYSLLQSCIGLRSDPFGVVLTGARRKYGGQLEPGSRPTPMMRGGGQEKSGARLRALPTPPPLSHHLPLALPPPRRGLRTHRDVRTQTTHPARASPSMSSICLQQAFHLSRERPRRGSPFTPIAPSSRVARLVVASRLNARPWDPPPDLPQGRGTSRAPCAHWIAAQGGTMVSSADPTPCVRVQSTWQPPRQSKRRKRAETLPTLDGKACGVRRARRAPRAPRSCRAVGSL